MRRLPHLTPNTWTGRLTIPVREALGAGDNAVTPAAPVGDVQDPRWSVTIIAPPRGLVLVLIGHRAEQHRGLRRADEPEYPDEWPDGNGIEWWERGDWTPCPSCGAALLWCEAGFVPGWRICLSGHALQLSADGRSAKRHAKQDASTLRATKRA